LKTETHSKIMSIRQRHLWFRKSR